MNKEMVDHYLKRTRKHIDLVIKYGEILGLSLTDHDKSKFVEPEVLPYVWLTWRYKGKRDGFTVELPDGMDEQMTKATFHHITHNEHHPESWDGNMSDQKLNSEDRDGIPEEPVDATEMSELAMQEMCCDWTAMGEELGNSAHSWADKVIGARYKFTPKQQKFIRETIDTLEK